jgi:hypothetical protein
MYASNELTSSRKPPNAMQNTNGPAKSVSSKMVFSGVRNGFSTESVCKGRKRKEKEKLIDVVGSKKINLMIQIKLLDIYLFVYYFLKGLKVLERFGTNL